MVLNKPAVILLERFQLFLVVILTFLLVACADPYADQPDKRLMVLGVDGMDHKMTQKLMAEGKMPNFSALSKQGVFKELGTSVPPLSPVAWSDFMTGMDSGGHGIYDFLHRDPAHMLPEFSMSKVTPPENHFSIGSWEIPTDTGELINLRQGAVFWEKLKQNGIFSSIIRMPANFPPVGKGDNELSGMGTPDIHGGYGKFTFISSKFGAARKQVEGGEIQEIWLEKGQFNAVLNGPKNPFKSQEMLENMSLPIVITKANDNSLNFIIGPNEFKISINQWSDWIPVEFEMMPYIADLHGMVRIYLRQISPHLELYISPINFDPMNPDTALSYPASFVEDLATESGRFYTQGMPEDTKALESGVLNLDEFFQQAEITARDSLAQLDQMVKGFLEHRRSFLFYYLGHLDQVSHMTWKSTDPLHPTYDPINDPVIAMKIENLYIEIDQLVGELTSELDGEAELMVISDHGFAPWRREMSLNAWLIKQGYLSLKAGFTSSEEGLQSVDWSKTKLYGIGFNGLYVNVKGREKNGIVESSEIEPLLKQVKKELLSTLDPESNSRAVTKVYITSEYYQEQTHNKQPPDLIVGFYYGYRNSSSSALGAIETDKVIFKDHTDQWSGDHSMDHDTVPGIFLSTFKMPNPPQKLKNMAETIISVYDLKDDVKAN